MRDRAVAADFDRGKLLRQFIGAYRAAPRFSEVFPMIEQALLYEEQNLFGFLHHALICACRHLGLSTPIRVSSTIDINHGLKNQDKVIALSKAAGATCYVNAIGGVELYDKDAFLEQGLDLKFIRSRPFEYPQFGAPFVPWLSIIDVLMFNSLDMVQRHRGQPLRHCLSHVPLDKAWQGIHATGSDGPRLDDGIRAGARVTVV